MSKYTFNGPVEAHSVGDGNTVNVNTRQRPPAPEPVAPAEDDRYDLAFSFAGADRDYVRDTKRECEALGLRVMFDEDMSNEWWGRSFVTEQRRIYGSETRFFVPFISDEYFRRPIPSDEFATAMWRDVSQGGGYILPVLIGDVRVPGHQLSPQVHVLHAEDYEPDELAHEMLRKVRRDTRR